MHFHNEAKYEAEDYNQVRPVIRTLYDHTEVVNDLEFHPYQPLLFSASKDQSIKIFEFGNMSQRKAKKQIQETHNVRSIAIHPSGDYLLAGTDHNVVRLYDINTQQCFTSPEVHDHHQSGINQVNFSADGKLYITAGRDGMVKVWDGVTGRCIKTMGEMHSQMVNSACFSRNYKYVLSCGSDGLVKLWDLVTGRLLKTYRTSASSSLANGLRSDGKQTMAVFNYDDQFVISSDRNDAIVWDTQTGDLVHRLPGHNKPILWIASSPTENSFMSCSEDQRARWWVHEQ